MLASKLVWGVYVHVPYCRERCLYCDFALTPVERAPSRSFADAVLAEFSTAGALIAGHDVERRFSGSPPSTLYFGGGTPSMLDPSDVARIVDGVAKRFGLASGAEITLEANPEDATRERFAGFRDAGVNRLSLGVQSLDDRFLKALGREHDAKLARRSIELARENGIENVSIDLIFGVEGMTLAHWEKTLAEALAVSPSHLSCYGLTVERGTKLDRLVRDAALTLPDGDLQADMYQAAVETLGAAGFPRYEISSFAPREKRSRHNSLYWSYDEWLGFGPSAHSFARIETGGVRWWNGKNPFRYVERGPDRAGEEVITGRPAMGEMAFTALRTSDGLDERRFLEVFGVTAESVFGPTFASLATRGLVTREGGRVALTDGGFLLSDSIFRALV